MQASAAPKTEPTESSDLNLYKKAAEVAYQFAKKRSEKELDTTEESFGSDEKKNRDSSLNV
jgi:hypothetical protein